MVLGVKDEKTFSPLFNRVHIHHDIRSINGQNAGVICHFRAKPLTLQGNLQGNFYRFTG